MRHKVFSIAILFILISCFFTTAAYADSSWVWLSTSPRTILPFAIILTLIIETSVITKLGEFQNSSKIFCIVVLANLCSFLIPYLVRTYQFLPLYGYASVFAAFDKGPYYIVRMGYLLITLLFEFPITYILLKKDTPNRKKFIFAILLANGITTSVIATCERLICIGRW